MNQLLTLAGPTLLASFLACLVECVEALTIVLAVGLTRGWKWSLAGALAGLVALGAVCFLLGSSLRALPLPALQAGVGIMLLLFGLRWLHKAVLRAAGVIPLHDEALVFAKHFQALRGGPAGGGFDLIAFLTASKAVVLEGIEVAFVVLAMGSRSGQWSAAAAGAGLALVLVSAAGAVLHKPLAAIPENTLKFGVGVLLAAFGTYWTGEGIGLAWPGGDAAILLLAAMFLALALVLARACSRLRRAPALHNAAAAGTPRSSVLRKAALELLGLLVDDIWLALGVVAWIGAAALIGPGLSLPAPLACVVFTAGLAGLFATRSVRRAVA